MPADEPIVSGLSGENWVRYACTECDTRFWRPKQFGPEEMCQFCRRRKAKPPPIRQNDGLI